MEAWPETRDTLIARLHDPQDQHAWEEFARLYEPLIYRVARKRGLQDSDAHDIAQRVLISVAQAAQTNRAGNPNGPFRAWLHRVATNATLNLLQRESKHWGSGTSDIRDLLEQQPSASEVTQVWAAERQLALFRFAASQVRERFDEVNWQCFWMTTVQHQTPKDVSKLLNKSIGTIYVAKSRIMAAIRDRVEAIQNEESSVGINWDANEKLDDNRIEGEDGGTR